MKKFLTMLLALVMALSLVACGQTEQSDADKDAEGGSTESPAVSLPTQEQVEQAAGSLYSAASTVLDAILGASGN